MITAQAIGRLGVEPELRHAGSTPVLKLRVACEQRVKRDGQWTKETSWIGVVIFGRRAEALVKILGKGERVFCAGRLEVRAFERRDGTKGTALELVADTVEPFGGSERRSGAEEGAGTSAASPAAQDDYGDDDIPF